MSQALEAVMRYHQVTKHRPQGYAPSPKFLDWDTQPDPFRRFAGATLVPLPLIEGVGQRPYDALYRPPAEPPDLSLQSLGLMFELALAAARLAAAVQGWRLRADPSTGDDAVAACLGLDRREDFTDTEPEHHDLIALLGGTDLPENPADWSELAASLRQWQGMANRLSSERVRWPQIAQVVPAVHKDGGELARVTRPLLPAVTNPRPPLDACTLIRQRRSVQCMDGVSSISRAEFKQALYQFTVGGPVIDQRLTTEPAYAHLKREGQ